MRTASVFSSPSWAGRITNALPVLILVLSATMKLIKPAMVVASFAQLGYPEGLIRPLGVVELAGTLLFVAPRTSFFGAIVLTGFLGGAVATHVRLGQPSFCVPILVGALVWAGLALRHPGLRRLLAGQE